jgi:hypothetical protein
MTTITIVLLLLASVALAWYVLRASKTRQRLEDDGARKDRTAQEDLMRKALKTRPERRED